MRASLSEGLRLDAVVAELTGWELVEIAGRDRERFLASQVTSDVGSLAVGESHSSALLDRSGRLQAFFFVHRRAESFRLMIPEAAAEGCIERLEAHVIADDVSINRSEVGAMRVALGPAAAAVAASGERFPVAGWGSRGFVSWNGDDLPWPEVGPDELEKLRIIGGPPAWDSEVRKGQLINETTLLDSAVSSSKGCYLGQETVNKVASNRGAVWGAVMLEIEENGPPVEALAGRTFAVAERTRAGEVLSATRWKDRGWSVVSLHRDLRVAGREVVCVFDDGLLVNGVIQPAPLLPPPSLEEMAEELIAAASIAFGRDRSRRAVELLERAVSVCPTSADAHESLGVILGRLGRHREAIETMHRLLEIDPSSVMAHSNLSLFHNQLGDREQAEHHLAMATRASMGAPMPDPSRESEEAEADRCRREGLFLQVLEIDPDDALAHYGLGGLALERKGYADAVQHLEKAVAADPKHAAAILALGGALEALGETGRAREVYERGVDVAAKRGDATSAEKMQKRLNALAEQH